MADYERSIPCSIQPQQVMEDARQFFMAHNFRVIHVSPNLLEVQSPGFYSTHQNPILGATLIRLTLTPTGIHAEASLAGVRSLQSFVLYFPLMLGVSLAIGFAFLFRQIQPVLIALLSVTPWLFVAPYMNEWIRNRTLSALDTFLNNLAEQHLMDPS